MIEDQYQRALQVLNEHKEGHKQLAERLLEKEVIFSEDLENIFGKRQWEKPELVSEIKKPVETIEPAEPDVEEENSNSESVSA